MVPLEGLEPSPPRPKRGIVSIQLQGLFFNFNRLIEKNKILR